jgi:CDP-diacylglycerol--glycerol-3-phosphate 3-phosphatidyltransferase
MEAWARKNTRFIIEPIVGLMARLGISPNALTAAGFAINVVAGVLIGLGHLLAGGLVMTLIAMPLDAFDGALARATHQQTRFGAFFDSVLDRFAEAAILTGLAAWFSQQGDALSVVVTFAALAGSFMVSYTAPRGWGWSAKSACSAGWVASSCWPPASSSTSLWS